MDISQNKIILITGGTASFGNAFLSKIIKTLFKEIRLLSIFIAYLYGVSLRRKKSPKKYLINTNNWYK